MEINIDIQSIDRVRSEQLLTKLTKLFEENEKNVVDRGMETDVQLCSYPYIKHEIDLPPQTHREIFLSEAEKMLEASSPQRLEETKTEKEVRLNIFNGSLEGNQIFLEKVSQKICKYFT